MNSENIMLNEKIQTQKTTHNVIPFTWSTQNMQIQRQNIDWQLPGAGGEGVMKVFWNKIEVLATQIVNALNATKWYTFKD